MNKAANNFNRSIIFFAALILFITPAKSQTVHSMDPVTKELQEHQFDLSDNGKTFLLSEARHASFFMLGELHGEQEIPALLRELWPQMWQQGYRYIAAEMSPWAVHYLEFAPLDSSPKIKGLWSKGEATFVHSISNTLKINVLWGCDMEEQQLQFLIHDLALANPQHTAIKRIDEMTRTGYNRSMAAEILNLLQASNQIKDKFINGISLYQNIIATLEIDRDRQNIVSRHSARIRRESLMKELFIQQYKANPKAKVFFRFGRNHLHRGYDQRGVSTLGNFVAEFAFANNLDSFNVAAFAGGGRVYLAGETIAWDERKDDLAFNYLAYLARYPATVFDLRPIRSLLHQVPTENRSPLQTSLIYWADSYDAIIYYKRITPFQY